MLLVPVSVKRGPTIWDSDDGLQFATIRAASCSCASFRRSSSLITLEFLSNERLLTFIGNGKPPLRRVDSSLVFINSYFRKCIMYSSFSKLRIVSDNAWQRRLCLLYRFSQSPFSSTASPGTSRSAGTSLSTSGPRRSRFGGTKRWATGPTGCSPAAP